MWLLDWFGLLRFGGDFCLFCGWLGWGLWVLCFLVGLLFVVVAVDLVCGCYSMVSSCVFSGCRLVGFCVVLFWFGFAVCSWVVGFGWWDLAGFMDSLALGCLVVGG